MKRVDLWGCLLGFGVGLIFDGVFGGLFFVRFLVLVLLLRVYMVIRGGNFKK